MFNSYVEFLNFYRLNPPGCPILTSPCCLPTTSPRHSLLSQAIGLTLTRFTYLHSFPGRYQFLRFQPTSFKYLFFFFLVDGSSSSDIQRTHSCLFVQFKRAWTYFKTWVDYFISIFLMAQLFIGLVGGRGILSHGHTDWDWVRDIYWLVNSVSI